MTLINGAWNTDRILNSRNNHQHMKKSKTNINYIKNQQKALLLLDGKRPHGKCHVPINFTNISVQFSPEHEIFSKPHNCRCVLTQKIHGSAVLSSGRGELTSHLHPTLKWPLGLYGSIVNGLYLHELLTVLIFPLFWPPYPFSTLSIPMGMWANVSTFSHICSTLSHNVNRKCWIKHLPLANIWGEKKQVCIIFSQESWICSILLGLSPVDQVRHDLGEEKMPFVCVVCSEDSGEPMVKHHFTV